MMKIIVSGNKYTDIDVAACAFGLQAFYEVEGTPSQVLISPTFNNSLTKTVLSWLPSYSEPGKLPQKYEVVVVDLSDPEHIDGRVDQGKIIELFDHHFGFEKLWGERLGRSAHIETVGSCATLIVEKIVAANKLDQIPKPILKLLATAIISNTLNLKAQVTSLRDAKALEISLRASGLEDNWSEKYYEELNIEPLANPKKTLENDTKLQTIGGKVYAMAQTELWHGESFLKNNLPLIEDFLASQGADAWFYTSPSIAEGKNYLVATSNEIQAILRKSIGAHFDGKTNIGTTDKLWLRKEIIREIKKQTGEI